jgi:RNA polymerase sigma factor (sigma-70 family)
MLRFFKQGRKGEVDQETDAALVQRYTKDADSNALGVLYARYMPLIYGICLKYINDTASAEDAVMHVYEQVARKLAESDVQNFKAWVCTVARNHCLMQLRKDKTMPIEHIDPMQTQLFDSPDAAWYTEDATEREALLRRLEDCLAVLPEVQRAKVVMFYFEEKSYQEISQDTQTEAGMVRSHIQNGRRNLRNCMEQKAQPSS